MADYDNNNRGVLFKNDNKETDRQPDYKGRIDVGGQEYWLSAWIKDRKGTTQKYMSLSVGDRVEPKEEQYSKDRPEKDTVIEDISDDPIDLSEIPF